MTTPWIPILEDHPELLPEKDIPVWLYIPGFILVGCRTDIEDGWLWANCYGCVWFCCKKSAWGAYYKETDDDYRPTHWHPLPLPPTENPQPKEP